jgi:hypothetical protein
MRVRIVNKAETGVGRGDVMRDWRKAQEFWVQPDKSNRQDADTNTPPSRLERQAEERDFPFLI